MVVIILAIWRQLVLMTTPYFRCHNSWHNFLVFCCVLSVSISQRCSCQSSVESLRSRSGSPRLPERRMRSHRFIFYSQRKTSLWFVRTALRFFNLCFFNKGPLTPYLNLILIYSRLLVHFVSTDFQGECLLHIIIMMMGKSRWIKAYCNWKKNDYVEWREVNRSHTLFSCLAITLTLKHKGDSHNAKASYCIKYMWRIKHCLGDDCWHKVRPLQQLVGFKS